MNRLFALLVLPAFVALALAQCPGQKDFPATVTLKGKNILCSPSPAVNDTCEDPENYYRCNNIRLEKADKSVVRFDLFEHVPDGEDTNPIQLCIDMVDVVDKNKTVDSAAIGLAALPGTAYYTSAGWAERNNDIIATLTCVTAQ